MENCLQLNTYRDYFKSVGYVPLAVLVDLTLAEGWGSDGEQRLCDLCALVNASAPARAAIAKAAAAGDTEAGLLADWMAAKGLRAVPHKPIAWDWAAELHRRHEADPANFLARADQAYPCSAGPHHWGFEPRWIANRLAGLPDRFARFRSGRRGDVAVLVGNGPSLRETDLASLGKHDVYIANYALDHPELANLARGVAVSNYFVAAQDPILFSLYDGWRAFPVWLSHVIPDSPKTLWVDALGGNLFFSADVLHSVAWHSTVSFFWMQILFHAGYRKLVLVGFDNSYQQPAGVSEGTLLRQAEDDPNHFAASYFRGKQWQAADPARMAQTYAQSRRTYEAEGREIVNCTVGGKLEVFRRGLLADEL